jgi:multidrug efflux pump
MSSFKAAILGANEVTFTVLSMSFSLVVIFMPILLMEGIVGRLFREFAMTMSTAIMVSLLISLTITPMLASKFLLTVKGHRTNLRQKFVDWMFSYYRKTLIWSLRRQRLILLITFCTFFGNILLFAFIPKGFFPLQDTGRFFCPIQAQQNMSFTEVEKKFFILMDILKNDPAVEHVAGFAGGANAVGTTGILFATLKPLEKRKASVFDVINRLRSWVEKVTGMVLYMQPAQDLIIGGRSANALFQYTLSAYDLNTLDKWVPKIQNIMSKIPGIVDLNSDQKNNGYQVFLSYNREAISRFGLTADQVSSVLHTAFGQRQVSTIYKDINQYHVVLEVAPQYWQNPDSLGKIYVMNAQNQRIPLSVVSSYISSTTLLQVNHQGQFPAATLSFNLEKGYSLGEIVEEIEKAVGDLKIPSTALHGTFQGTAEAFQKSVENQPYLILGAIFVVYILLGILYESLIHPITIISTLPSAGIGGLLGLLVMGMDLSVIGLIGMLLLIGIVKKNAIMMIDFALDIKNKRRKSSLYAIYKASLLRFRPIMMTTFSALFGAFPLAFESGLGSELRSSLGILIIGGLIFSQILTLYTTPVVYLYLERVSDFLKHFRFWQRKKLSPKEERGLVS